MIASIKDFLVRTVRRLVRYLPEGVLETIVLHVAATISDDITRARGRA